MLLVPPRPPTRPRESVVPMINIVFLLLIFFLMTAQIAPPEPFEVTPPEATDTGPAPDTAPALHIGADGELAFGAARDDAVWAALRAHAADDPQEPLIIRADAALPGALLATILPRLAGLGLTRARLVTVGG